MHYLQMNDEIMDSNGLQLFQFTSTSGISSSWIVEEKQQDYYPQMNNKVMDFNVQKKTQ